VGEPVGSKVNSNVESLPEIATDGANDSNRGQKSAPGETILDTLSQPMESPSMNGTTSQRLL